ncbi:MAG TPA: ChbG/HpnK family deacetylase [Chthoniobacteraceae bacterium]|nr:ChbG/HpnK family deacetylase [Chthoniobacteraceae bacterium]
MKQLILTGDDFGRSAAINEAVERHHRAGVLTQASLMVNERAVDEAVRIARRNPRLCVGLHLTLGAGRAARVSPITDLAGNFIGSPALAGLRYAFDPRAAEPLGHEIAEQFARFRELGFGATHVDGHTHLHLHPIILRTLLGPLAAGRFKMLRLVREPGNFAPIALVFRALSAAAIRPLRRIGVRAADHVFGLRDTGRMTGERLGSLIARLPEGLSEIYFHPGAEPDEPDFAPLRELLDGNEIVLTSAATLPPPPGAA